MGDDITIGVTEIVNNIEVTAQPNDQIVDISVIDNADDVTLNITPTVIEINVNRGSSFAKWGTILGTLSDQTDLQNALNLKANLVGGKVPASELPSYVDDVVEVADYAALPATGETGKIYVTLDNNKIYRWSGSVYIEIAANSAIWGAITGTLSSQTDLQAALDAKQDDLVSGTNIKTIEGQSLLGSGNIDLTKSDVGLSNVDNTSDVNKPISTATQTALDAKQNTITLTTTGTSGSSTLVGSTLNIPNYTTDISGLVPYAGATANVNLGTHKLTASDLVINHASGSSVAASITKGGNGEALTVLKTSGSGNAASILGGITLLDELHLNTDLADAYIASAATWNAKQNALTFSSPLVNTSGTISIPAASGSVNGYLSSSDWTTFNNKVESVAASLPLGSTGGKTPVISITQATTSSNGYLSSTDWNTFNGKQTALSGTGFVKISGTTISYDNSTYVPTSRTLTINGTTFDLSANRSWTITAGISGSGTTGKIPLYTGSTALGDSSFTEFSTYVNLTKPLTIAYSTATSGQGLNLSLNNAGSTGTTLYLYNAGTGNLAQFQKSNNTTAFLINASGNVGIGTASPNQLLHIEKDQNTYTNLRVRNNDTGSSAYTMIGLNSSGNSWGMRMGSANANSNRLDFVIDAFSSPVERMSITSGGNVGIGTTSPSEKLVVGGSSGGVSTPTAIRLDDTYRTGGAAFDKLKLYLYKSSTETYGFGLGDVADLQYWAGTTSTGTHRFFTSQTERMSITSGGELLIGTTSSLLASSGRGVIEINGSSSSIIGLKVGNSIGSYLYSTSSSTELYSTNDLKFAISGAERMRITSGGNVGIGTTSPAYKLEVSGTTDGVIGIRNSTNNSFRGLAFLDGTGSTEYAYIKYNANTGEMRHWSNPSGFGGYTTFYSNASESMRITSTGDVLVGRSSLPAAFGDSKGLTMRQSGAVLAVSDDDISGLFSRRNSNGDVVLFRRDATTVGSISVTGSSTSYNTTSDYRLKEDLKPIKGLDLVSKIKVYDFKWKNHTDRMDGVLAHELQKVVPYAVSGEKDAEQMQSVDYSKLVPILVQAIQELKAEIEILKNK